MLTFDGTLHNMRESMSGKNKNAAKLGHILALASGVLESRATTMAAYLEDAGG
jgi:hypothetical protein